MSRGEFEVIRSLREIQESLSGYQWEAVETAIAILEEKKTNVSQKTHKDAEA